MKRMKGLALALLAICLLAALPAAVMAEEDYIIVGGIRLDNGEYLAADEDGATSVKPESGGYAYYNNGVLELNNYSLEYRGDADGNVLELSVIYSKKDLTIELKGSNSLKNIGSEGNTLYGIYVSGGLDETAGTLIVEGEGSLTVTIPDNSEGIAIACGNAVKVLSGTLKVNGGALGIHSYDGSISISGRTVTADSGIIARTNLTISGGTVNTEGILGGEYVTIEGGKVEAASIEANGMTISGGTVNVADGGISVYGDVTIKGGTVNAAAIMIHNDVTIKGGTVETAMIVAGNNLTISGGAVKVGDSNAPGLLMPRTVHITGGTVEVDGMIGVESSINIDPPMQIVTPAGGTVGKYSHEMGGEDYEVITILNPKTGKMAEEVYIAAVTAPADLPQTGDASRMGLWLALGLMSCAGLIMAKRRTA